MAYRKRNWKSILPAAGLLLFTGISVSYAAMTVLDPENLAKNAEQLNTMNKQLTEITKVLEEARETKNRLGSAGIHSLTGLMNFGETGTALGEIAKETGGICYNIEKLMNFDFGDFEFNFGMPSFEDACSAVGWVETTLFTVPKRSDYPDLTVSELQQIPSKARAHFMKSSIISSISTALNSQNRLRDDAASLEKLHTKVIETQENENSGVKEAISANSMTNLRVAEELMAIRELMAKDLELNGARAAKEVPQWIGGQPTFSGSEAAGLTPVGGNDPVGG